MGCRVASCVQKWKEPTSARCGFIDESEDDNQHPHRLRHSQCAAARTFAMLFLVVDSVPARAHLSKSS